jgi:ABC-type phosphate transport system ATPase subunit
MFEGSILEVDTPEKMFTSPANDRTRQFLQSVL